MPEDPYPTIRKLLTSTQPDELRKGLELAKQEIAKTSSCEAETLVEIVSGLFYIDPLDRPELVPLLDEAVSVVGGCGDTVIPVLLEKLDAGDLKAQFAVAHALGRIGADAIEPLMAEYNSSTDPARRTFVLYALGKIKSPKIVQAAYLALEATQSDDVELRDTATRAIGKFAESILPSDLSEELCEGFIKHLHANLADPKVGIRAKAVRSLGKLARYGHLTPEESKKLEALCRLILGIDEHYQWDEAYIVRKEAVEALQYV